MLTLIKIDLRQRIKNPLTWFVIFVLCMMSILNIIEMKNARLNRPFKGHDMYRFGSRVNPYNWSQLINENVKKMYPKAYRSFILIDKIEEDLGKVIEENNIDEINRLYSFYFLLWAKDYYVRNDPIMDIVFEKKVIKMWNDISDGIAYEDIDFYPIGKSLDGSFYLLYAKYYYQLYINDFEPIYSDDINNITYLYDYFFNIAPKFIIIIPILFIYNIINKEKNTGSLRLILTQSVNRWKYYISKWISGALHVVLVLFLPPIIISNILGMANGFVSMKYPTIYLKNTMANFKPIPNYMDAIKTEWGHYHRFGNHTFSYYASSTKVLANQVYPHNRAEIIPFYKYLLMVILLTILFVAFTVALTELISAIINKEILSFVATSAIFVIGTLVSSPIKYEKHLNLSPFTMEHASRIVIGTYNVTALVATIILLISTILLLVIGTIYFKKKEI